MVEDSKVRGNPRESKQQGGNNGENKKIKRRL